jgi:hypothetical protein
MVNLFFMVEKKDTRSYTEYNLFECATLSVLVLSSLGHVHYNMLGKMLRQINCFLVEH